MRQRDGLTDIDPAAFRAAAHAVVDVMADYLETIEDRPVFPPVEPGSLRPLFPAAPPEAPEPLAAILDDYRRLDRAERHALAAPGLPRVLRDDRVRRRDPRRDADRRLGQNAMLWRTSPIGTELEEVVVDWLRQALGLPEGFDGLLTDTASTSSLIALAAARQAAGLDVAAEGLAGRPDVPALRVYASTEAHSSIEKACMTLGLGRDAARAGPGRRRVTRCARTRSRRRSPPTAPPATGRSRSSRRSGTTSSTSVDPVAAIADIAEREGLWLHVDSAYAGVVAILPERRAPFAGWERADSIVVNPHKWLFTPLDASLLLTRRMADLRAAFSLVPEYLRTLDREAPVRDYNEYTPQLGRRFRALKLWIQLRWFGLEGLRRRIERHLEMAQAFAGWVDEDPDWERLAPVPFSTVCFRWNPLAGATDEELDARNAAIMDAVNRTGEVFLSHTRLAGRFTIRLAIGNLRTEPRHVERAWALLREAADGVSPSPQPHDVRFFATPDELRDWFDANHETADELWLGYYRKSTGRPSVDWSQAVDEALCVGWIDGVRRERRRDDPRPAVHAAPQGQHLERDQRREGRGADRAGPDAAGRDRRLRGSHRTRTRRSTRTSGRRPRSRRRRRRGSGPTPAAWADWEARPPSYRRAVTHWVTSAKQPATRARRLDALIAEFGGRPQGRADALVTRNDPVTPRR